MKTTGLVDVLRTALAPLADRIDVAFVFGSLAAGHARADSDVDLFAVGTPSLGEVIDALGDVQPRLAREVNPVVQTRNEFQARLARADHFISGILPRQKLFVIGDDRELERLATQRMADAAPDQSAGDRRPARDRRPRPAQQPG
jgi:predicted nucleotidyltransferase